MSTCLEGYQITMHKISLSLIMEYITVCKSIDVYMHGVIRRRILYTWKYNIMCIDTSKQKERMRKKPKKPTHVQDIYSKRLRMPCNS